MAWMALKIGQWDRVMINTNKIAAHVLILLSIRYVFNHGYSKRIKGISKMCPYGNNVSAKQMHVFL